MESILLVDDDPVNNFIFSRLLEKHKLCGELYIAPEGREALNFLKDDSSPNPDLIVLDLLMPVMDGFKFLKEKDKTLETNFPVIISSVLYKTDIKSLEDRDDVVGCISKPLDLDEFFTVLARKPELNEKPDSNKYCGLKVKGVGRCPAHIVDL